MGTYDWETVDVPQGAFIGWGTREGQHVTGKVLTYGAAAGSDFDGNPCPQLTIELIEPAASFNKAGERTNYPAGELVSLTVGQYGLKAAVIRANPEPGDLLKITLTGVSKTNKGNDIKNFDLKIARGAGGGSPYIGNGNRTQPAAQPAPVEAEPPF
jgi:hypothetical protein